MQYILHRSRPALPLASLLLLVLLACGSGNAESQQSAAPAAETAAKPATDHPEIISHGAEVQLADYLKPGQITVFDFMSDYCPPCRQIAPYMERLHAERVDITVVKVDINRPGQRGIDWRSPVARQFGLQSIPHFKVYDAEGKLLAEGQAAQMMVFGWLNELPADKG